MCIRDSVTGVWITHPLYGPQITCEQVERRMPREEEEIVSYLASGTVSYTHLDVYKRQPLPRL